MFFLAATELTTGHSFQDPTRCVGDPTRPVVYHEIVDPTRPAFITC